MVYLQLALAALMPVLLTILLYFVQKQKWFSTLSYRTRQVLIGVAYGILACLATQFGIPYEGFVLNARNASPITAGLLFGAPAGVIAGAMGAIYRAVSVLWGLGETTWIACCLSTLLSGIYASILFSKFMDRKTTAWYNAFFVGLTSEVLHMLLVFITYMNKIKVAYDVVRVCSLPMIIATTLSVTLSILAVRFLSRHEKAEEYRQKTLAHKIGTRLYCIVLVALCVVISFTYYLENNICMYSAVTLLQGELSDVKAEMDFASDQYCYTVVEQLIELFREVDTETYEKLIYEDEEARKSSVEQMKAWAADCSVSHIFLLNSGGKVVLSSDDDYIGADAQSMIDSFGMMEKGASYYYQEGIQTLDGKVGFVGAALENGNYVLASFNEEDCKNFSYWQLSNVAASHHVGYEGFTMLYDSRSKKLISTVEKIIPSDSEEQLAEILENNSPDTMFSYVAPNGVAYQCMYSDYYSCQVVVGIPLEEVTYSRNVTLYITIFTLHMVFMVLFLSVFYAIRHTVVDGVHTIASHLGKITSGDLDTHVEVGGSYEFEMLSRNINQTVDTLKKCIAEANERIDQELLIARTIQSSALPSVFPAYPNCPFMDIYAHTKPAREVGGDFYDFTFLSENVLMFLIADVSGKGIPAAMFMMRARTLLKSYAESGKSPSETLTKANHKLCISNDAEMFVTVWIGYLDLSTGKLRYSNAGHNPPVLIPKGQEPELLRTRSGLVLSGLDDVQYRESELQLQPGDQIFLYTDGVSEAFNPEEELFGTERLMKVLAASRDLDARGICKEVASEMAVFVGEAPQFDDITMLSLQYLEKKNNSGGESQ